MALVGLTDRELQLDSHLEAVSGPEFGAVVAFVGQIRDHDPEATGEVESLEYTAHPDAEGILAEIVSELEGPDIRIAVSHRTGMVGVGEPALIACVSSAHRERAYEVSRALVERVKSEVPIWKRQIVADGSHNWQGLR